MVHRGLAQLVVKLGQDLLESLLHIGGVTCRGLHEEQTLALAELLRAVEEISLTPMIHADHKMLALWHNRNAATS